MRCERGCVSAKKISSPISSDKFMPLYQGNPGIQVRSLACHYQRPTLMTRLVRNKPSWIALRFANECYCEGKERSRRRLTKVNVIKVTRHFSGCYRGTYCSWSGLFGTESSCENWADGGRVGKVCNCHNSISTLRRSLSSFAYHPGKWFPAVALAQNSILN